MEKKVFSATTTLSQQEVRKFVEWINEKTEEQLGVPLFKNEEFLRQDVHIEGDDLVLTRSALEAGLRATKKTRGEILKRDNSPWALGDE